MNQEQQQLAQQLIKRCERLKSERARCEPFFRDVRNYIRPRKQGIDSTPVNPGQRGMDRRYDSTATDAAKLLAHSMQNALTPASVIWFGLRIPEGHPLAEMNENETVAKWFQDAEQRMFFAMHQGNFYNVIGEAFIDFTSFATMVVYSETDASGGLVYKSHPVGRFVFAENSKGRVDTVMEEYDLTARQAAQEFGEEALPEKIKKTMEDKPDDLHRFLRVVMPRDEYDDSKGGRQNMPYALVNIYLDGKEIVGEEGGYQEFPYAVGRFDKASGELYGRGPADVALPDIKTLNRLRELELLQLAVEIYPVLLTRDRSVLGGFKNIPGAINFVADLDGIKEMRRAGNFQVSSLKAEELKASIRKAFYADSLILPEKSNMTAEEIITIRQQVQQLLGPTVARFESEVLVPIVLRTFGIMMRAGEFAPPPRELLGLDEIDVKFIGQLAKAQQLGDVTATSQWLNSVVATVSKVKPEALDNIDFDEIIRVNADRLSVPKKFLVDRRAVQKMRLGRAQAQAEAKSNTEMMAMAEGVGKAGPGVKALQEAMAGGQQG